MVTDNRNSYKARALLNFDLSEYRDLHKETKPLKEKIVSKDNFGGDADYEERIYKLPCNHVYHEQCIKPWIQMRFTDHAERLQGRILYYQREE